MKALKVYSLAFMLLPAACKRQELKPKEVELKNIEATVQAAQGARIHFKTLPKLKGESSVDPFASEVNKADTAQKLLGNLGLKELHFVGTLKQRELRWALLVTAAGQVIHVKKGDKLGEEGLEVVAISTEMLQLKQDALQAKPLIMRLNSNKRPKVGEF